MLATKANVRNFLMQLPTQSVSTNVTSKNLEEHKFSLATRGFWGLPTGLDPFVSAGLAE